MLVFTAAGLAVDPLLPAVAAAGVAVGCGTSAVRSCVPLERNPGAALQHKTSWEGGGLKFTAVDCNISTVRSNLPKGFAGGTQR